MRQEGQEKGSKANPVSVLVGEPAVRVTDTNVYYSGCQKLVVGLVGRLPVRYYCRSCVAAGPCPCENRPGTHSSAAVAARRSSACKPW